MALLGKAAMVLTFEIVPEAIVEHDDWHTHEHLPERLSIPGFLRGTRWTAAPGRPRYFVLYEVEDVGVLTSAAYLERLNNPTPWTAKMMTHYRAMTRGLCRVTASAGRGLGTSALLLRFMPAPGRETALRQWLSDEILPPLASRSGLASLHLFEAAATPQFTNEQRIRGMDATVNWALLATGYDPESVASLASGDLNPKQLERHGATGIAAGTYQMGMSLAHSEPV